VLITAGRQDLDVLLDNQVYNGGDVRAAQLRT
jgi:hypothetical protein